MFSDQAVGGFGKHLAAGQHHLRMIALCQLETTYLNPPEDYHIRKCHFITAIHTHKVLFK
jgi:hypothetical protein